MASISSNIPAAGFSAKVSALFASISSGMIAYMERRARSEQLAALQAKSDDELANLGITREQIPAYVFRDLFYV